MKIDSSYISETDFAKQKIDFEKVEFKSGLQCFMDHNGFRKGEIHVFVAPKGGGKSTLAKTILSDIAYSDKITLMYLSEEKKNKYFFNIKKAAMKIYNNEEKVKSYMDKMHAISEIETDIEYTEATLEKWKLDFEYAIDESNCDIIIFDNISTSFISEIHVAKQSALIRWFKKLADKRKIPFIVFIHTGKGKNKGLFDGDSVKGSGSIINIGSYNYVLIMAGKGTNKPRSYLWIEKARYHPKAHSNVYKLDYNYDFEMFTHAEKITMDEFVIDLKND